jgi:ketosteroid isomerase-like protein
MPLAIFRPGKIKLDPNGEADMKAPKARFLLLAMMIAATQFAIAAEEDAAAAIVALENKWAEAAKTGDAAAVEPMLAETFVTTDVNGHSYSKKELLANLKGGKWESNGISDVKVSVYGDTAIATGAWAGKGIDGDGTRMDRHERWTDTWVKTKAGRWECVASHASEVK